MEPVTLIINLALVAGALALILYPLWQQIRPEAIFHVNRAGQTLEEYEARYQASLASIKDLMFDYEMGKVSTEDYETLLHNSKLEAAQIRRQIDRISQDSERITDPALDAEIEALVSQLRGEQPNGNGDLLQEIDAEIESLKHLAAAGPETDGPACPNCGKGYQAGDAFCAGCGQALPDLMTEDSGQKCPECGSPVEADDAFCAKCGFALTEDVAA